MRRSPLVAAGTVLTFLGAVVVGFVLGTTARGAGPQPGPTGAAVSSAASTSTGSETARQTGKGSSTSSQRPRRTGSASDLPARGDSVAWVEIRSVGIRSRLTPDGLSDNGTISPPAGQAIWFTGYGRVMPGLVGTSVIAGHIEADGRPDVFASLPSVKDGARVRVGFADGKVLSLTVVRTEVVDKNRLQTDPDVWGENHTSRRVALITCDDAYGFRSDGHRVANFVAIATPT